MRRNISLQVPHYVCNIVLYFIVLQWDYTVAETTVVVVLDYISKGY